MSRTNFRNICPEMTVRTQTIVFALNSSDLIYLFYFLAIPDIMSYSKYTKILNRRYTMIPDPYIPNAEVRETAQELYECLIEEGTYPPDFVDKVRRLAAGEPFKGPPE